MRIAIFGTGGAGGRFGAQLALAGEEVAFIARRAHLRAIRADGLRVATPDGEWRVRPAEASDDPAEIGPVDLVILGVKAWQVPEAARGMGSLIGPATAVLPLQNGIEAAAQLSETLGAERVLGGLCATFSWIEAPGLIRSIGQVHYIRFGEQDNSSSARTRDLQQTFDRAGVQADIPADIQVALWEKFLFVVSFGGLGAVTRAPIGVIRSLPQTRRRLEQAMDEIFQVGRAGRIALEEAILPRTMEFVDSLDPAGTTSLQRDIAAGRPSELEAWNGAVVRVGREVGVPTPLHSFIYEALLPLELRTRGELDFPGMDRPPPLVG